MKEKIEIGILAGGKSTRMGKNKALLEWNNRSFLQTLRDELQEFSRVSISAAQKGIYEDYGLDVVYDEHQDIGPMEGIYQILKHAQKEYVFICAVDMPFITKDLVAYMTEYISSDYDCYCMMDEEHMHPLCAIYSKRMLPLIEELIQSRQYRLMKLLNQVRTKYIRLETSCFEKKVVRNINTKEEYRSLILPVVFCVSAIKDSGKTGLIIKLINEFIQDGYRVGVIKHDGHDYEMDHPGTDTFRFTESGACVSAIFSKNQYSINGKRRKTIEEMVKTVKEENNLDVIIIEGMKASAYPKVEVVRKEISTESVCDEQTLICIASDILLQKDFSCPVKDINDITGIYTCIRTFFQL